MLETIIDALTGRVAKYTLILLVIPFISTWVRSSLRNRRPQNGEPPMVPHIIPWFGHTYGMVFDLTRFAAWIRKSYPNQSIVSFTSAGKQCYMVFDAKLVSQIYRRVKSFDSAPLTLLTLKLFGMPKADVQVYRMNLPSVSRDAEQTDDGRRIVTEMRSEGNNELKGPNLAKMISTFTDILHKNLEKEFPSSNGSDSGEVSADWVKVDLCHLLKKQFTIASIPSLFGTHLLKMWPSAFEDLWNFDDHVSTLMLSLPEALNPTAFESRERILKSLVKWEKDSVRMKDFEEVEKEDPVWDEYWGARMIRNRHRTYLNNGISEMARATLHLRLLWGQNVNAIPAGMWMVMYCILNEDIRQRVQPILEACRNPDGTFNVIRLVSNSFLKSFYLETLRFTVASPTVRVVVEPTELGGYRLEKGNMIQIPSRQLQMDRNIWSPDDDDMVTSATKFYPERFLDSENKKGSDADAKLDRGLNPEVDNSFLEGDQTETKLPTDPMTLPAESTSRRTRERMLSMRPFGGGVPFCPGRHFAIQETLMMLVVMLTEFDIEIDEDALKENGTPEVNLDNIGGMLPDRKMMVNMRRRSAPKG